jgi:predicted Zn-dependent protease
MTAFFDRLQRATRIYEGGAPSYLRTHPLTFERIADVQNRVDTLPYRQIPDSVAFQLIRAKLKAEFEPPREAVAFFREALAERRYLSEPAVRYGLTLSLLRLQDHAGAQKELVELRRILPANAIVENLGCRVQFAAGDVKGAMTCYGDALRLFPGHRALVHEFANALLASGQATEALKLVESRLQVVTEDHKLYLIQARAYAILKKAHAQHRAQGEAYARMGNIAGAVEQMQLALKSGDGDFFLNSSTEARLRELRRLHEELRRDEGKR